MTETTDTSFYRLYPQRQYKPTIFYEKNPIHGERHDNKIDYKPEKVEKIKSESEIKLEDIEKEWQSGIYKHKDINTNPYRTMKDLHQFYHEPDMTLPRPPFVPSDKIYLNDRAGITKQWQLYARGIGH